MKKFYFLFSLMFYTSMLFSQSWLKNLPQGKSKKELNFFDYKNAFNKYWTPFKVKQGYYYDNGIKTKARGWKQFKRWEYYMEGQINPTTGEFPKKTAQKVYDEYLQKNPQLKSSISANWTSLGSNSSDGGYAGIGRINCIAFHPTDINTYWVGAASGGLWVTTNNGSSWTCLTDNNGVLAVSDIIIPTDYATSNTIYIATGDRDAWDNYSVGVLKSTNSGSTWNITGLSFALSDNDMVNRLLLDPNNNQIIIAATTNGVYKTINGGNSWNTQLTTTNFIDMEYKPGNFSVLYGSTEYGKIYVTANNGGIWTKAFDDPNAQRIELAVSANQPAWVYAIASRFNNGLYGIFKSTDNGSSYSEVFSGNTKNLLGWSANGSDSGGQGWYDLSIAVSPSNANTLLIGGVNTWRSIDGGNSWVIVNHWAGDLVQAVHADKHMLAYQNNGNLFECNDGGVYVSTNNGTFWTDKTNGMIISQIYKLGVSKTTPTDVITGLQDNGTKLFSQGHWKDVIGGDGMECLIDNFDVNVQYGSSYYGNIVRTLDHWVSDFKNIQPSDAGDGAWVTPFIVHPSDNQTLYAGYENVWKTTNRGDSWKKISSMYSSSKIRSMAIASSNTRVLYVADLYNIWKTTDDGTSWTDITGNLAVGSGSITSIAVKNDDAGIVWATLGGYNGNSVFQTSDSGSTWTNISAGLPEIPAYSIIQNIQSPGEVQLYVGTELGIYFKKGSANWIPFNTGLPNVKIGEIEIYYSNNPVDSKLRAATYGRGLWESPVFYESLPMTYISSTTTQNNTTSIAPNQTNQEIIGVEIVTNGNLTPLSATAFNFNTIGSTKSSIDILKAKLYYTGSSSTFAANSQFGATSNFPTGSFAFYGNQTLGIGTNYFWLTFDIPSSAALGDVLDAQCTALTVGTTKTPTITAPTGNRMIAIDYCSAGSLSTTSEYISNVTMENVNQNSSRGNNGYEDYKSQIIDMQIGKNSTISASITYPYMTDELLIWVDWNIDGDFNDGDENVYNSGAVGLATYSASFAPAVSAKEGITRMRIRLFDTSYQPNSTSCGNSMYGEVEDYSINVLPPECLQSIITFNENTLHSNSIIGNQWHNQNGMINGAINQDYTVTATGYYYDIVSINGCSPVISNIINVTKVGIESALNNNLISVYPNPFTNDVIIEIEGNNEKLGFEMINSTGQIVLNGSLFEKTIIPTKSLNPGIYLLKLDNGKTFKFRKIVKE